MKLLTAVIFSLLSINFTSNAASLFELTRELANEGNANAQALLGQMYESGEGVPEDDSEAVKWYRKAAEHGLAEAQHYLGLMYVKGIGVPGNDSEAVKWYRKAAEQGHAKSQLQLGVMYGSGAGISQDNSESAKWFQKAAEQGLADAQHFLGLCYAFGNGVHVDDVAAVKWYRKAAVQGHVEAQFKLGLMYYKGRGAPEDDVVAYMWWNLSAAQGHKDAKNNKDIICKDMTREQIAEAQKMSREWLANNQQLSALADYSSSLRLRIDAAWEKPAQLAGVRLAAEVVFDVSPSGQITNVQLRPGSGNKAFDQSILTAFRNASSAGPTPTGQPHQFSLPFQIGQ